MTRDWARAGLDEAAYTALAEGLAASELWSLLLNVAEQRAAQRSGANLLQQWEKDRFVGPAYIDQRTLNQLDGHLLAAAADFEALELSPLAPLGSCSAIALASQNKIVSTVRGTQCHADHQACHQSPLCSRAGRAEVARLRGPLPDLLHDDGGP
jgi:hypothetical protein